MVIFFTIYLGLDHLIKTKTKAKKPPKNKNQNTPHPEVGGGSLSKGFTFIEMLALLCLQKQCVALIIAAITEYQRLGNLYRKAVH
jgi:hypothetical protein